MYYHSTGGCCRYGVCYCWTVKQWKYGCRLVEITSVGRRLIETNGAVGRLTSTGGRRLIGTTGAVGRLTSTGGRRLIGNSSAVINRLLLWRFFRY